MGVTRLWDVLEPVKEDVKLSELCGLTIAIDLSGWIVQSLTASKTVSVSGTYIMLRTLVCRIVNIVKNGIKPVFVLDGEAPEIKSTILDKRQKQQGNSCSGSTNRQKFRTLSQKCIELIEALGLPYLVNHGEAEQLCAWLNSSGNVDGCMSDDGDCFLYEAKTVYRNYDQTKKDSTVERYRQEDIEDKLGLTRRDLIVFALLSGCDYNEAGVQGVGQKKTLSTIHTLKSTHQDVLTRILSWRDSGEIKQWKSLQSDLTKVTKNRHCKYCNHTGSVDVHNKSGCSMCKTSSVCELASSVECSCDWHDLYNQIQPNHKELDICDKALKNPDFPNRKVVEEFLKEDSKGICDMMLKWSLPDFRRLFLVVEKYLKWDHNEMIKVFGPAVVFQGLYDILPRYTTFVSPIQIVRSCQDNFIACYEVKWKLKSQLFTINKDAQSEILVKIEKKLFQSKYPDLVEEFEKVAEEKKSSKKKGKRKKTEIDRTQTTVNSYFISRKKLKFEEVNGENETVSMCSKITEVIEID